MRRSGAWRRIPKLLESSPIFMLAHKALMIQWLAASPISFHALCPAALKCQPNWPSFNSPNAPRLSSQQGCCTCSASQLCEHILPWSFHYILCLKSILKCIAWREAFLDCPVSTFITSCCGLNRAPPHPTKKKICEVLITSNSICDFIWK